ncbi:MAG TPA: response regulator, partial [Patescibacteria group bacterium]|nr:response regulator [Patescibacteria group bacterium]
MSAKPAKKKAVKKAVAKPAAAPASPQPAAAPAAAPASPTAFVAAPAAAPAPKPAMSGVKVLIIDDDPFISGMYATRLANDGFTVCSAPDGFQGLKKAAEVRPDVILLDVLMPK